ncbi:glycerol-3-phosphate dehydrogenase/oxidase [Halioxenophilus sp. WMMB6]|uniref:glycerol-3-phosphate dehydrogenase/oxidase n=1 Tax=Halioxenophilus sp. WMMB6 TaxID=3073815 RepID=UPI00295F1BC4|nr:FAD-dependent oxidoreductase [Halioxenophilus sp. WMMB6]
MAKQNFDVVVIGAGIHGAAVARQAVEAGKKVLILEQFDRPAKATSSRSSKLIHGGLRYLESFNFGLVRECLLDRRRLLQDYGDLVHMQKFYIPIYKDTSRTRLTIRAGLSLYGLLGGLDEYSRFSMVPQSEWANLDGLEQSDLLAVFQYWDAQTDDAKLTFRLLEEAVGMGATLLLNTRFSQCREQGEDLQVSFQRNDKTQAVTTRAVVNATGPWVNETLQKFKPAIASLPMELVQGAHLELPGSLEQGVYYLEAPQDRRAIFAMPWYDRILFGTTETLYQGDPNQVQPTPQEIDYLLTVYNYYFPDKPLGKGDIINAWAGLRVLPAGDGNPFKRSRDTILQSNRAKQPTVVSIYGGKLTSHYSTAKKVLKLLS